MGRFVDGILVEYGDDLFEPPYRSPRKPKNPKQFWKLFPIRGVAANNIRNHIKAVTARTPEVMVKITNKKDAGKGMERISAHLDYISRNGKEEIEDCNDCIYKGKAELETFKSFFGSDIPDKSHRKEAFNIIFSMPKGTNTKALKESVKDFIKEEFENNDYVFVLHTDTENPHVHVCVNANPKTGRKKLNPRKNDISRWRVGFAERLRSRGIAANATTRKVRGEIKKNVPQNIYNSSKRKSNKYKKPQSYYIKEYYKKKFLKKRGGNINYYGNNKKEYAKKLYESNITQINAWNKITNGLLKSDIKSDKKLSNEVNEFINNSQLINTIKSYNPILVKSDKNIIKR